MSIIDHGLQCVSPSGLTAYLKRSGKDLFDLLIPSMPVSGAGC
jgi:hypothetical protein